MTASRISRIADFGQQVWLDKLSRSLISSGELQRWIDEHRVAGVTSNPAIFAQALAADPAYQLPLKRLRAEEPDAERRFERLVLPDVRSACDLLRPLYERSDGAAGYVSFEVSPRLAHDGRATLAAARRLWAEIDKPNAMIKIPATAACHEAIAAALAEGINVNITLIFSQRQGRAVFDACADGLARRHAYGLPLNRVRSVASVFVSRLDTLVDSLLTGEVHDLKGEVAIASARACYAFWQQRFGAPFDKLRKVGARPPMCLWASTGTKNPAARDVRYVEALIGPETVDTVPDATLTAFADHGEAALTLNAGTLAAAPGVLRRAAAHGIDLDQLGERLQTEGLKQFDQAFDRLIALVNSPGT